jgi:hypothetical protein
MDPATFTIEETVVAEPPLNEPDLPPETRDVRIECTRSSGQYVNDDGVLIGFNAATFTYPDPAPFCGEARSANQRRGVMIAAVLVLAALGLTFLGPLRQRLFDRSKRITSFHDAYRLP